MVGSETGHLGPGDIESQAINKGVPAAVNIGWEDGKDMKLCSKYLSDGFRPASGLRRVSQYQIHFFFQSFGLRHGQGEGD